MLKSFPILSSKQNSGNFSTNSFIQFDPVKTMIMHNNLADCVINQNSYNQRTPYELYKSTQIHVKQTGIDILIDKKDIDRLINV